MYAVIATDGPRYGVIVSRHRTIEAAQRKRGGIDP